MDKQEKMRLFPGLLTQSTWDNKRMIRLKRRDKIIWFSLAALTSFFVLWTYIGNWQGASLWQKVFAVIYVPFMLWIILIVARSDAQGWSQIRTGALALRQAAEDRDEQIAPLAAEQPAPFTAAEIPIGAERLGLFGNWRNSLAGAVAMIILLFLPGGGFAALLVALIENHFFNQLSVVLAIIVGVLLVLFGLAALLSSMFGLLLLALLPAAPRHAYIVVDESGVRWWERAWGKHSRFSISWYDVRSFFMIAYPGNKEGQRHRLYVLDAHAVLLLWRLNEQTHARILAAHERFCRLIVTRTKLPLRDLSAAVEKLVSIDEPSSDEQQPALAASPVQQVEEQ